MYTVPGLPPVIDLLILLMMVTASILSLAAWRSPRTRGGQQADVIRALKCAAWGVLGCWYTFRFVENGYDLKMTAITGLGFFLLTLGDILCGLIAMKRAQEEDGVAEHQAGRGTVVHGRFS